LESTQVGLWDSARVLNVGSKELPLVTETGFVTELYQVYDLLRDRYS